MSITSYKCSSWAMIDMVALSILWIIISLVFCLVPFLNIPALDVTLPLYPIKCQSWLLSVPWTISTHYGLLRVRLAKKTLTLISKKILMMMVRVVVVLNLVVVIIVKVWVLALDTCFSSTWVINSRIGSPSIIYFVHSQMWRLNWGRRLLCALLLGKAFIQWFAENWIRVWVTTSLRKNCLIGSCLLLIIIHMSANWGKVTITKDIITHVILVCNFHLLLLVVWKLLVHLALWCDWWLILLMLGRIRHLLLLMHLLIPSCKVRLNILMRCSSIKIIRSVTTMIIITIWKWNILRH